MVRVEHPNIPSSGMRFEQHLIKNEIEISTPTKSIAEILNTIMPESVIRNGHV